MSDINIIGIFDQTISKILNFTQALYDFLFSEINIFGYKISMWAVLGGALLSLMLTWWIVKKLVF